MSLCQLRTLPTKHKYLRLATRVPLPFPHYDEVTSPISQEDLCVNQKTVDYAKDMLNKRILPLLLYTNPQSSDTDHDILHMSHLPSTTAVNDEREMKHNRCEE